MSIQVCKTLIVCWVKRSIIKVILDRQYTLAGDGQIPVPLNDCFLSFHCIRYLRSEREHFGQNHPGGYRVYKRGNSYCVQRIQIRGVYRPRRHQGK